MATRNILHISKLEDFKKFLESKGYLVIATSKNPSEALRAVKGKTTLIAYQKKESKDYISTMDKDYELVKEFIQSQKTETIADKIRRMTDYELAELLCQFYQNDEAEITEHIFWNYCRKCSKRKECDNNLLGKCPISNQEILFDWLQQGGEIK